MNELKIVGGGGLTVVDPKNPAVPHPFEQEIYLTSVNIAGLRYVEGATELIRQMEIGERLNLYRQPDNEYDPYAIRVCTESGTDIGWIPRANNRIPARLMDAGKQLYAVVKETEAADESVMFVHVRIFLHDL